MRDQVQDSERQDEMAPAQEEANSATAPSAAHVEEVRAQDRSHFFALANSLIGAMHWQSPELLTEKLTQRERHAVTLIYEARTSRETELGGGNISGLERMRYLNEGLATLQGILVSAARSPNFPQAHPYLEEIRRLVAMLKAEIARAIVAEERRKQEEQDKQKIDKQKGEEEAKAKKKTEAETKKA